MRKPRLESPVVWRAPPIPSRSKAPHSDPPLPALRLLDVGHGPEDVVVDSSGRVYAGLADGNIVRATPELDSFSVLVNTGGRPLGLEILPDGRLLVCDAQRGLLAVDPETGSLSELVSSSTGTAGRPMVFCNNAAVSEDGTIYFTDSSKRFGIDCWRGELYEHSGTGRLLSRSPSGAVAVLVDGLQFANGVALAPDESYVLVAETSAYRITRYGLTGPDSGASDVLVDNLPGFPDNISLGGDGLLWVALPSPRDPRLDLLLRSNPLLRKAVWALPEALVPVQRTTWVQAYDLSGGLVHDLQDRNPRLGFVTGVREHSGTIYLGSLESETIGCFSAPPPA